VEIAIAFPLLIILFSGMVEFGFVLNYYLALLDGTREAARFYSNADPFEDGYALDPANCQCPISECPNEDAVDAADSDCDRSLFYSGAAAMVKAALEPSDAQDTSRKIVLDPAIDDIIITVLSVEDGVVTRYPSGTGAYHQYNNQDSKFKLEPSEPDPVLELLIPDAPDTGVLIVEVVYGYTQILNLPWLDPFLPEPTMLRAYTVMPLVAAEPVN